MKNVVKHRLFMVRILLLFVFLSVVGHHWLHPATAVEQIATKTPIKHLVVIYSENHSFDNYFATYPVAANQAGEPRFTARGIPSVNGLTGPLLTNNPNSSNPFRIERKKSFICDQSHDYTKEQLAYNGGLVNKFPQETAQGPGGVTLLQQEEYCAEESPGKYKMVLGYYDGNTVTALWNYAQNFALSDNFYATTFGPSTIGALNLIAGDTYGELCGIKQDTFGEIPECGSPVDSTSIAAPSNGKLGTMIGDTDPYWDICSVGDGNSQTAAYTGRNVGDLLNDAKVTWGWFQGGFKLTSDGGCSSSHVREAYDRMAGINAATDQFKIKDYIPHHDPFQYFAATANPKHLPPSSIAMVGKSDRANHNYDLSTFWEAAASGNLPAVSFLKAPAYQDAHPGYSDPLDEQVFLVETINRLQNLPQWRNMAIIIAYDDSDGFYDHVMPPILNHSNTSLDHLCGESTDGPGGRCGYGPRVPLLAISPYAKKNYVSHSVADQSSILRLIEDNWLKGQRISDISFDRFAGTLNDIFNFNKPNMQKLILDPYTGLSQQRS